MTLDIRMFKKTFLPNTILNQAVNTHEFTTDTITSTLKAELDILKTENFHAKTQKTSLTKSWGEDKQELWEAYKEASIRLGLAYLDKYPNDIFSLYRVLADCRRIIAFEL